MSILKLGLKSLLSEQKYATTELVKEEDLEFEEVEFVKDYKDQ